MRLDDQFFFLTEDIDQIQLEHDIIAAVRAGGDFVRFDTLGHGHVSVLITAHFPVRFETVERSEDEVAAWEAAPPPLDVDPDYYFE
jgi:hypothetical protein